eukprot:29477-Pelagococcus_subviridis.AAC.2
MTRHPPSANRPNCDALTHPYQWWHSDAATISGATQTEYIGILSARHHSRRLVLDFVVVVRGRRRRRARGDRFRFRGVGHRLVLAARGRGRGLRERGERGEVVPFPRGVARVVHDLDLDLDVVLRRDVRARRIRRRREPCASSRARPRARRARERDGGARRRRRRSRPRGDRADRSAPASARRPGRARARRERDARRGRDRRHHRRPRLWIRSAVLPRAVTARDVLSSPARDVISLARARCSGVACEKRISPRDRRFGPTPCARGRRRMPPSRSRCRFLSHWRLFDGGARADWLRGRCSVPNCLPTRRDVP